MADATATVVSVTEGRLVQEIEWLREEEQHLREVSVSAVRRAEEVGKQAVLLSEELDDLRRGRAARLTD